MSWHITAKAHDVGDVLSQLDNATAPTLSERAIEQADVAKQKVKDLLETGVYGGGPYNITISGHPRQSEADPNGNTLSISIHSRS